MRCPQAKIIAGCDARIRQGARIILWWGSRIQSARRPKAGVGQGSFSDPAPSLISTPEFYRKVLLMVDYSTFLNEVEDLLITEALQPWQDQAKDAWTPWTASEEAQSPLG